MGDTEVNNAREPRGKLIIHSPKLAEHMQVTTGVIDANVDFDHSFLQWNLEIKYFTRIFRAYEKKMIGQEEYFQGLKKPGIKVNLAPWKRMQHVWYYGLDILIQKNADDTETVAYAPLYEPIHRLKPHQYIKHLPALKKMNPVGQLQDDTLGIYIRDLVPIADAWEGYDLATMVTSGKWIYEFSNGNMPQFSDPAEIANSGGLTDYVSRGYWHKVIDIEEREMMENEADVYLDNHNLIANEILGFAQNPRDINSEVNRKATILV